MCVPPWEEWRLFVRDGESRCQSEGWRITKDDLANGTRRGGVWILRSSDGA